VAGAVSCGPPASNVCPYPRSLLPGHHTFQVECLLAQDDEVFTYNKRVNRLAVVQEHFMIVRANERGVPEEKLARAYYKFVPETNLVDVHMGQLRRKVDGSD
jgi:hypothetical protein